MKNTLSKVMAEEIASLMNDIYIYKVLFSSLFIVFTILTIVW